MENIKTALDIIKANSLNEEITVGDIADTDEIVSAIIDQKQLDSLALQICDIQPMHGPTGAAFAVMYTPHAEIVAQAQVDTVVPTVLNSTLYTVTINGTIFDYTSDIDATATEIVGGLVTAITGVGVTGTNVGDELILTADVAGTPFTVSTSAELSASTTTPNIVGAPAETKTVVKRTSITVEDDAAIDTGFTLESIQDMQAQFGKSAIGFISKTFGGLSSQSENVKLISKLSGWAVASTALTLSNAASSESNVMEISQKVAELIVKMNGKNYRTLDSFVILPQVGAASFLALSSYFTDTQTESGLFIGKTGRIKYYLNPDPTSVTVYVGLNSQIPGNSSVIFSPYKHAVISATDPDSGQTNLFNINRYAMTLNPLSETDNEMLYKFDIA